MISKINQVKHLIQPEKLKLTELKYFIHISLLNKDMNKQNSSIVNFTAEIQSLQDRNDSQAKTQQKDERRRECQEAAYVYQQRRAERDNNRQTVSDLINILNSNMRDLKEYFVLRVAAGDMDIQ